MSKRVQDRVSIVTGASRGIGEAIARAFAAEGAKVVLASRNQEALDAVRDSINATHPGSAWAMACHTGRPEQVEALVERVASEIGEPTILVNNAATNPYFGPMLDAPDWAWDKTFDVNAKGYFVATRAVARRLRDSGQPGSIINVASVVGMRAAKLQGIYGMTKAAVISMTQTLAFELGPFRVRVNAIAPGLVDTKLASMLTEVPELSRTFTSRTAFGEYCQPDAMAGTALWLASDESSYVTGQTIAVDGGYTVG